MFGKSPSFVFLQERLEDNIFHIVRFMQHELLHSKFRPALLEYKIDKAEEEDRLIIDVNGRDKIILTGIIDRVDIFDDENGEKYVRIIDYKTGKIDLKYSMLYNGLNLQMFVYLTALLETKNPVNIDGGLKQAGIVYYALGQSPKPYEQSEKADDDSSQRQARLKAFKPIGKVVDIKAVTDAFNSEEKGAYSPLDFKAKGIEGAVPDEFFTKLRNFATAKVSEFGQNLCNGNIHARPVGNACAFCDFHDICGRINQEDEIDVNDKIYEEKLMAEEGMMKTDNDLIHIGKPIHFDTLTFLGQLEELARASYNNDKDIVEMVEKIVPTFSPVGDKPTGNEKYGKNAVAASAETVKC